MFTREDIAVVIVTHKPNRIWVVVNNEVHSARWRTTNPGESANLREVKGNERLLGAALFACDALDTTYTMTVAELEDRSGGGGVGLD